jgi:hypothetical protein
LNTLHVTDGITLTWVVDDLDSPPDNQGSPLVMESLDYPMVLVRYAPLYVVPTSELLCIDETQSVMEKFPVMASVPTYLYIHTDIIYFVMGKEPA